MSQARRRPGLVACTGLWLCLLGGCALFPDWHWAKAGASEADYERDEIACKALVYNSADGMVTQAQVRRMHLCLQSKGWQKVGN